jgi:D-aminoacyl-tRNA deacylase
MRAVVQRVTSAAVTVDDRAVGSIDRGLLVFEDPTESSRHLNRSVADVGGSVLVVSQFTLAGDCRKGRRPSFDEAEAPAIAERLYEDVVGELRNRGLSVATGRFQATMRVSLVNDGPVTLLLDSRKRF